MSLIAGSQLIGAARALTNPLPQPVRYNLRRLAFTGRAKTCVLCGNSVRRFSSHGGGADVLERRKVVGGMRRDHDSCPICHGRDRTRMMMLYLDEDGGLGKETKTVLHVAPDLGLYLWLLRQPGVMYAGSDIDKRRYRHIENMHQADLTATPFEMNQFDIVICSHVLEHVPDDRAAMREILRILKPGGMALLLAPFALDGLGTDEDASVIDPAERHRRFGQWDHVRIYGLTDFMLRTRECGFQTSMFLPYERFPDRASALDLNPLEILPICQKPVC